ncbi:MAG: hypothetical protein R2867_02150 [Caldilineaceae bacterium]|nr:hypothetical protein [Caldilineaceae bacterium]
MSFENTPLASEPTPTIPHAQPSNATFAATTARTVQGEESERKRVAIGLAARRPTARPTIHRPPRTLFTAPQRWLLTLLLFALLLSTGLMVVAKLSDAPTSWSSVLTYWQAFVAGEKWPNRVGAYSPGPDYQLRTSDDFNTRSGLVACTQQAGEWATDVDPALGVYRMQIWPGHLTWSTIALEEDKPYRVDASFTVVDMMPTGYTGFIGRYQDPDNFYLFMVDGFGQYQVQLWQDGDLITLQPWTASPLLNPAGFENLVALEDNGSQLRFGANGGALVTIPAPALPTGSVGFLGGASPRAMAEIHIDWLRVYDLLP